MTKAGRSTFVLAISLLSLLSLPKLTCAQQTVAYGTWSGYATYTETDYDQFGNVIGGYSSAGNSALSVDITRYLPNVYVATVPGPPGFLPSAGYDVRSFGPTSAVGFTFSGGEAGFMGSFDVTYQSILPDGEAMGGFAIADFSGDTFFGYGVPYIECAASFKGGDTPEPSAIVLMSIGAVVVATSVVIRRRRAGNPPARP